MIEAAETRSTRILLISFALVIALALIGTVVDAIWGANFDLIREAMRFIGVTGPTGSAAQSAINALGRKRDDP